MPSTAARPGDGDRPAQASVTDIPARLDALAWSPFHTRVVVALGITWILDGLEVTLAGAVSGALQASPVLRLTDADVGLAASAYLAGAVLGAIFFGWLTDRLGRKRLFWITLGVYLAATAATAFAPGFGFFLVCRFLTGAGIGGEYAAINSAIQELVPARHRGQTDLVVNGSFWVGAGLGAVGSVVLLEPGRLPLDMGWRAAFGIGAALGLAILLLRRHVPESPRWLMTHGRVAEAEAIVAAIEAQARRAPPDASGAHAPLRLAGRPRHVTMREVARTLLSRYRRRTLVGLVLMASQAFFYNAIFFTYALVLGRFFGVASEDIGLYLLPFAAGNFLGPLLLGRLFDTVGRRPMIAFTYAASGVLLAITAALFAAGVLGVVAQTAAWSVVFFFASAAASSAYLTVGESFPLEIRALSIALFYAFGTAIGGVAGPWIFGELIGTGERASISWGYAFGAALMLFAAAVQWRWGLDAERRSLEEIAAPLGSG
jgi:MFS family permease